MFKQVLFIFISVLTTSFFVSAQDFPYPISPVNTGLVNTTTPTLTWKESFNFTEYKIEIESCSYDKGSSFDVLELENFVYQEVKNGPVGYETSALTYSLRRPDNYFTVDDNGDGFTSYTNNFNTKTTHPNSFLEGEDYEGLTYIYNDVFVMVEERLDLLHFLKFDYDSQGALASVTEINTIFMNNNFISGNNDGWEGLTYNPRNNKLYLAKEFYSVSLYETNLPSGNNFTGSVNLIQPFNVNATSWVPTDISGLFHVSLDNTASATPAGNHILIISQEDEKMFEIDLNGNLISEKEFNSSGIFGSVTNGSYKPEGITFQNGDIWIASDAKPGVPGRYYRFTDPYYQAPTPNNSGLVYTKSNISGGQYQVPAGTLANNAEYCWRVIGITANGFEIPGEYYSLTTNVIPVFGCTDNLACNFNTNATMDNGSCLYADCIGVCGGANLPGATCNDNNSSTINDKYNSNCVCIGDLIGCTNNTACNYNPLASIDDGSCLYADCVGVCGGANLPGATCNDNNSTTINDKYNSNCFCIGDLIGCTNNTACNYNPLASIDDGSCLYADCLGVCGGTNVSGATCNDNNSTTINDKYNSNCVCIGNTIGCTNMSACNYDPQASTDDGSCKYNVDCAGVCGGSVTQGVSCNDGDSHTINDVYDFFCNCIGIPLTTSINICFDIKDGDDDVEETVSTGNLNFTSNDLDVADTNSKIVGMRFKDVDIPYGANILNAYLQFTADEYNNQLTNLTISIENSHNAALILNTNSNISLRNYINDIVQWNNVLTWTSLASGGAQKSPAVAQLVQQVVDKNGWQANNSMLFKIAGTGKRAATSFDSDWGAPQLCVEYLPISCPQNLTLTSQVENNQTINVEKEIESSSRIINSSSVNYFAGDTIELMMGFETNNSSNFSAVIQDCQ